MRTALSHAMHTWRPKPSPFDFVRVVEEFVFPRDAVPLGRDFSWLTADVPSKPVPKREEVLAAGREPLLIFDVVVETEQGILAVVEIVHTNPPSAFKRDFVKSLAIPLYEVRADPWLPRRMHRGEEPRSDVPQENPFIDIIYALRDEIRKQYDLPAMKPYIPSSEDFT